MYGICMFIGIVTVILLANKSAKKYNCTFWDLLIVGGFALMFALPCGSILYTFVTYDLDQIVAAVLAGNFRIFGGLVFYGSLIGGIFGALVGVRVAKLKMITVEQIILPFIPIGHAIGRVGCLLAGCCYGIEYNGLFAVYYKSSAAGALPGQGYFPVQLLEALLNILICFLLIKSRKKVKRNFELLSIYLILYGIVRFLLEFLRGDAIRGMFFAFSTSQWIAITLIIIGLAYLLLPSMIKRKKKN